MGNREDCIFSRDFKEDNRRERWGKCHVHVEAGSTTVPMKVNAIDSCKYFKKDEEGEE